MRRVILILALTTLGFGLLAPNRLAEAQRTQKACPARSPLGGDHRQAARRHGRSLDLPARGGNAVDATCRHARGDVHDVGRALGWGGETQALIWQPAGPAR